MKASASKTDQASSSPSSSPISTSGCKPWIQTGLGLVSSGHRELDDILGGGCPLGTVNLVLKDRLSNYADTILSYALSESLSHDQSVLLLAATQWDVDAFINSAPLNLNYDRANGGSEQGALSEAVSFQHLENEKVRKDDDRGDAKLTIAWQYEKYLGKPLSRELLLASIKLIFDITIAKDSSSKAPERTAVDRLPFCCSYDLSRRLAQCPFSFHV